MSRSAYIFRGIGNVSKIWHYGSLVGSLDLRMHICPEEIGGCMPNTWGLFIEVYSWSVGMFTGVTDIKNKKVFGGDVIKYQHSKDSHEYIGEVWYNEKCAAYWIKTGEDSGFALLGAQKTVEVIGNIHEK